MLSLWEKNIGAVTVDENDSKFSISIRGAVVVGKIRGQELRCRKQVKPSQYYAAGSRPGFSSFANLGLQLANLVDTV